MSRSELARFCNEYLPQHPELKQRFDARDPNALAKGLALVGAEAGYDFSEFEVAEAMIAEASAELSDGQLDAVAGGTNVQFQEIKITKHFDKSTPVLMSS
jgi:hypothetical protein